jgi:uncharacterized protein YndB with AHSA1/START domain
MTIPDRIEKSIVLRAPRSRVWRALTNHEEFGAWFGVKMETPFVPGAPARGQITTMGYEHVTWNAVIDRIVPETLFSFRWRPFAIDPAVDYSDEPMTLVTFELADVEGGTLLTVVESGFDGVPLARRAKAFEMNDRGWGIQMTNIERHVASAP